MKNIFYITLSILTSLLSEHAFAADAWILGGVSADNIRKGNITFNDIPLIINYATKTILGFAATVAVVMIIYGAFQMALFGLTSQEKKKGAETITHGIIGFVIAVSSWFIINMVMANL